jgi:hypothetical protein
MKTSIKQLGSTVAGPKVPLPASHGVIQSQGYDLAASNLVRSFAHSIWPSERPAFPSDALTYPSPRTLGAGCCGNARVGRSTTRAHLRLVVRTTLVDMGNGESPPLNQ